ncbi:MAG: MBL fold metallo-hydrolase, partial [Phaeodactylibacter sp.]|nr:MBL fold metallo-hydrolase [Phaeodactylibacter sp.]
KAEIEVMDSFSAHADRNELAGFVENQKGRLKKLFLVHGTLDRQEAFRNLLQEKGFQGVEIPELGQEYEL